MSANRPSRNVIANYKESGSDEEVEKISVDSGSDFEDELKKSTDEE